MRGFAGRFTVWSLTFGNSSSNKKRATAPSRRHHVRTIQGPDSKLLRRSRHRGPCRFGHHAASRYVAIDEEFSPPRLAATTWPNRKDAVNYLVNLAAGRRTRILNFKDRREVSFDLKASLLRGAVF